MTQITITSLGHRGDGLAELNGRKLHISRVLAGEIVELVEGRLTQIVEPSAERVAPFCPHFELCGGCKFQHWHETPYQAWKQNLLHDALASKGIETTLHPLLDAHGPGRRRVSLHVRQQNSMWVAGFMEAKSHDLVPLDHCPVLVPELQKAPRIAADFGPAFGVSDVAITAAENGLDVSVKAERQVVLRRFEAMNDLMRKHGLIRLNVNGETHTAFAAPRVRIGKADVSLPVTSFLQATARGEAILADRVLDAIGKSKHVADLFCGVGPFTLRLAEKARVDAFDNDKHAISALQDAVRNTQGLKPIAAQARDLFRDPLVPIELAGYDTVILDPPRAGAEAQCRELVRSKVKRVVMVACDVANFARDAAILKTGGFVLKHATPVDQFKWTAHLEMVGVFER